jgi:hypothetical protein
MFQKENAKRAFLEIRSDFRTALPTGATQAENVSGMWLLGGRMSRAVCFLCGSEASLSNELDRREGLTVVNCPACGPYSLTPQMWTADERLSLVAYVRHEAVDRPR